MTEEKGICTLVNLVNADVTSDGHLSRKIVKRLLYCGKMTLNFY